MSLPYLVMDLETDPFEHGERPNAFLAGICDGLHVRQWWSDKKSARGIPLCIEEMLAYLERLKKPHYVYAHNGGKFDFFFLPWPLEEPTKIVNGRIIEARLGKHILRDSFAIMPFGLDQYRKEKISYATFAKDRRDRHKARIQRYHATDCISLFELVDGFIRRFGPRLTIATTAHRELKKRHDFTRQSRFHDAAFRPFFFGGRVEAFRRGILKGRWKIYDVNSMYPHVMSSYLHPRGNQYVFTTSAQALLNDKRPGFACVRAVTRGAFPIRTMAGLCYPTDDEARDYHVSLYELRAAVELSLVEIEEIKEGYIACDSSTFAQFVLEFSQEKKEAKARGDRIAELQAKYVLNSSYGKFATNPENHFDWKFVTNDERCPGEPWELYEDAGWLTVWRKPAEDRENQFYDVAIGASITGAARAELMRALHAAVNPVYCDTDSIICEELGAGARVGAQLGEWKLEGEGDRLIVCGKKLYCLTNGKTVVKMAHKGVEMSLKNYLDVARGKDYIYQRDAPTYRRDGGVDFIQRRIAGI